MNPPGARGARAWPRAFVAATALVSLSTLSSLLSASCAAPLMKLPAGAGVPAADAAGALAQATAACRGIKTLTAEIAITGSAGGHRVRGRLLAGVAAPASVRLEFVAPFGPPLFIFAATGSDATLVLPRDERVVEHGDPAVVLNAVAGVPLDRRRSRRDAERLRAHRGRIRRPRAGRRLARRARICGNRRL